MKRRLPVAAAVSAGRFTMMRRVQHSILVTTPSANALLFILLGIILAVAFDLRSLFIRPTPELSMYDGIVTKQGVPQGDFTKGGFMFYFVNARMLVTIHQKSGTTSFWNWMYKGLTNKTFTCDTYVQDVESRCWTPHVKAWWLMSETERHQILSDTTVLRIAIHRDPFDRVVSCWKSKFACDFNTSYKVDLRDQPRMMQVLRQLISTATNGESIKLTSALNLANKQCLSLEEYANMLDVVSDGIDNGRVNVFTMESHVRPQIYFYQYVNYSVVLSVDMLKNVSLVKPIVDRLPYIASGTACGHVHSTKGSHLVIPERTALKLARYASWSERAFANPLHWMPQVYNSVNAW